MRLNKHIVYMIFLTAVACLAAVLTGLPRGERRSDCAVAIVPRSGIQILSDNPVRVRQGESAAFQVRFDEGYFHNEASGLRYENGVLFVDDVRQSRSVQYAPQHMCALAVRDADAGYVELLSGETVLSGGTAEIRVTPPQHYSARQVQVNGDAYAVPPSGTLSFPVYEDSQISLALLGEPVDFSVTASPVGIVQNLQAQEEYHYGDEVILRAGSESESVRFDGWSADAWLSDGGAIVSTESELRFTLNGDVSVFANFTDLQAYTVTIDPNGGSAAVDLSRDGCSAGQPLQLPADVGALQRESYALVGYNTQADGSGRHYSLSAPMIVSRDNTTVYAEWLPETPGEALTYETADGYAVVSGLTRKIGETLVIPESLGGLPVRGVAAGAFRGNARLKTAVVPLGVTRIGKEAFADCPGLSLVYLPETLQDLGGGAFGSCPSFTHLRLLSENNTHVYERTFDAALADRYQRLVNTGGKHLIIVAGSSGSFGLNSAMLAERYPDYQIVNFSGSYLYGILPMMFYVKNNIHPGDVVVFAPEYYRSMYADELNTEIANWMYLESNYNMLDELDLQIVDTSILGTLTDFLDARRELLPDRKSPRGILARANFNEYGDMEIQRTNQAETEPYIPKPEFISATCVKVYSTVFSEITEKGGACLFSFPPISNGGASPEELAPGFEAFEQKLRKAFAGLPCAIISNAVDYIFPADQFYDNKYHMTSEGAILRTNQLIADLDAYGLGR